MQLEFKIEGTRLVVEDGVQALKVLARGEYGKLVFLAKTGSDFRVGQTVIVAPKEGVR